MTIAEKILRWYDIHRRDLPWRRAAGRKFHAYCVWLSEIMLQQTTVKAVIPYYESFLTQWPNIKVLAQAEQEDVLKAWAGLGYYSRARNLHLCAQIVVDQHSGMFPENEAELLKLPGVGRYTAAAIAAIAFDQPATVVDGNVERVMARLFKVETPLSAAKAELRAFAQSLTPEDRPGDYAQGVMDLGATICTPKNPSCSSCPLRRDCLGFAEGLASVLPYRSPKADRPLRLGAAFFAMRDDEKVLLRRRPPQGLLGGMMEVPTSDWDDVEVEYRDAKLIAPVAAEWQLVPSVVRHTFTHFHLELSVYRARVSSRVKLLELARPEDCRWVARRDLAGEALPSVMRKVIAHALNGSTQ